MRIFLLFIFSLLVSKGYATTKHNIDIKKFKFSPAEITIEVGDSIRWTNKEKRQYHNVWFEQLGEPEPDYFFPDEFFEKTFNDIGDFPYRCGPHPRMIGAVHVISAKKKPKVNDSKTAYKVESVEDGDTIVIEYKRKTLRVQLIGIDAPEDTKNPKLNIDSKTKNIDKADLLEMGTLATKHLKALVKAGQTISLQGNLTQKDKYNRLPAVVLNEKGESLNKRMVEDGYALLLTRFPISNKLEVELKNAEKQAIKNKTGLWKTHNTIINKWSGRSE